MKKITYAESGVNISQGDAASREAYSNAKKTFASRKGMIGEPFALDGGFSGALDMGDYLLVQNDDGVGTKMEMAERLGKYDTIGEDLVAMVADDAICVGAECISITNTVDTPKVDKDMIASMTEGLARCCRSQKIVIPGGEIAELGNALNRVVWNATAVGIVKKEKFITGQNIRAGHKIIGLRGRVIRSNGSSLARKVCETAFGKDWHKKEWRNGISWGEILLTPSKVFHRVVLDTILGDFTGKRQFPVHGVVHITGGGVPGNVPRILPKGLGAQFTDLHEPHQAIRDLQKLGNIDEKECYRTWHCGTAMMLIVEESDACNICNTLNSADSEIDARIIGEITHEETISLLSKFSGTELKFSIG
ncbi:phosphoribosylformylglycinamidine cyclo-ligase [Candidatus Gracilibacteria bacterium]|nr:phosphoribosylformylglycinamidine cyclo-ligase [Candidatus Gracilibacteria bacterium]